MATQKEMIACAGSLMSDEQAMQLGRAAFALALLGDGCVAMVGIFDHRRDVGVYGPGSPDPDFDIRIRVTGNCLPVGRDLEKLCDKGK